MSNLLTDELWDRLFQPLPVTALVNAHIAAADWRYLLDSPGFWCSERWFSAKRDPYFVLSAACALAPAVKGVSLFSAPSEAAVLWWIEQGLLLPPVSCQSKNTLFEFLLRILVVNAPENDRLSFVKNTLLKCKGCSQWGYPFAPRLCSFVAETGDLASLRFLFEKFSRIPRSFCFWDKTTCEGAACAGSLECLRFAHENGCPWDSRTCENAARARSLRCLQYAHERGCPWDSRTCTEAIKQNCLECLEYAHKRGCVWWSGSVCEIAAMFAAPECLRYAHENGGEWTHETCARAIGSLSLKCLCYAHENGSPWDWHRVCDDVVSVGQADILRRFFSKERTPSPCERRLGPPSLTRRTATRDAVLPPKRQVPPCDGDVVRVEILAYTHEKGGVWSQDTCLFAAANGDLACLQYAHEHGAPWDCRTSDSAAYSGNVKCLRYAFENGCPLSADTCSHAAASGRVRCLRYAHKMAVAEAKKAAESRTSKTANGESTRETHTSQDLEENAFWTKTVCENAASAGSLKCLKYAHENGCPWDVSVCDSAARINSLECLKYAHENGCPWDAGVINEAAFNGNLKCLHYAQHHGCPCNEFSCEYAEAGGRSAFYVGFIRFCSEHLYENATSGNHARCFHLLYNNGCVYKGTTHERGSPEDDSKIQPFNQLISSFETRAFEHPM